MTPFIDMMFILVIFFLATSRFQQEERDESIRLAKSRSQMPIAAASDMLVINVDKDGRKIVDGKVRTLDELEELVRTRRAVRKDSDVVIRADERARVGQLQEAHEICVRQGFKAASIAYQNAGAVGN